MNESTYHYTESGLDNIYLKNGFVISNDPVYGEGVSIVGMESLHKVISDGLTNLPRILTGKEFRYLRIELDLSQKSLARMLGVTDQTIARWEKGEVPLPQSSDLLLRLIYKEKTEGCGKVSTLIDQLTDIDQKTTMQVFLEEANHQWRMAS